MNHATLRVALGAGAILVAAHVSATWLVTPKGAPGGVKLRDRTCAVRDSAKGVEAACDTGVQVLGKLLPGDHLRTITGQIEKGPDGSDWYKVTLPDGRAAHASAVYLEKVDSSSLNFEVRFFGAEIGDVALVSAGNTDVLVDGGGAPAVLTAEVLPRLRGDIELLIITHLGADHWKGLGRLIAERRVTVKECWIPSGIAGCTRDEFKRFVAMVKSRIPKVKEYSTFGQPRGAGGRWPDITPEIDIDILHSCLPTDPGEGCDERADNSALVFVATIGGARFMFTSDIRGKQIAGTPLATRFVEQELLGSETSPYCVNINVLKVPHYGMETSSTSAFIDKVAPRNRRMEVIFSSDSPTSSHKPADSVLDRYRRPGITIWQTDSGTVLCKRDSNPGRVRCSYQ